MYKYVTCSFFLRKVYVRANVFQRELLIYTIENDNVLKEKTIENDSKIIL